MKTKTAFILGVLLLAGCLAAPAYGVQTILPSDQRFQYEGRFDFNDANSPVVIWQASRISIDFEGDTITLLFDRPNWQNFFNAQVDGTTTIVEVNEGVPPRGTTFTGLGKGHHHLVLFKRSEANAGTVRFRGVQIADGAQAWKPTPVAYKLRMEFYGDSKTVGACNEDDGNDQWDNRLTHNSALSYAAFTAEAFSADYRNISVSGMGIITGYVDVKAGEMWNRLYPNMSSPLADLNAWTPNVVFVNLGDNDESFTRTHNQPFPAGFTEGYVSIVRAIRAAYPKANIVLLRGGMFGGMHSEYLNQAWKAAVTQLESGDKGISHFVFKYQSMNHPRVAEDRVLADELIAWLKQQDFMQPYR
ncbi:MAG: GDSL-type esterase/lipase family protein [Sedimentisphaerales bacterium]|nr:GDSL-type esterase/lipase family protein [Sedimentisphaerales bacterium]